MTAHDFVYGCVAYNGDAQADEQIEANRTRFSQNSELAANIVTIQIPTRTRVTLKDVTMLGYCSGL